MTATCTAPVYANELPAGTVVETTIFGKPTGNIYKLGDMAHTGARYAYQRFTNHRVTLHSTTKVIPAEGCCDSEGRWV